MGPLLIGVLLAVTGVVSAQKDIRQVDFKNFIYPWSKPTEWLDQLRWLDKSEPGRVQLVDGRWRDVEEGESDRPFSGLTLESVQFADVTGDGRTDALVVLRFGTGGTQYSHYVYIYSFAAGEPKLLAYFHSGDRAYSGLYRVYGQGGKLVVELFDPEKRSGDCCSSRFIRTRYQWHNGQFQAVGAQEFGIPNAQSRLPVTVFGTRSAPEGATVTNEVSQALIGKKITIRGKFSLRGKIAPALVVLDNHQVVYLNGSWGWGTTYSEMEDKLVEAT